ncbi:class I SAM-dependent methyltransferase [Candidatus Omnitrophota bacterium]
MDYLQANHEHRKKGYLAENVESFVFRVYGRIFKGEFGIDGSKGEKLLDFGCGGGTAVNYFHKKGFDAYGVDMSEVDIQRGKEEMPEIADRLAVIDPKPKAADVFFGGGYDIAIAIQSMYYLSAPDLKIRLDSIYNQMKPGALIYATMMGTRCDRYYNNSVEYKDGLRKVDFSLKRIQVKDNFINFTESEADLLEKFKMFKKVHLGYYDAKYIESEGSGFHYIFIGQK